MVTNGTVTTLYDSLLMGNTSYELSNHLGNVLAVVNDKKIGVSSVADSSLTDHYVADVLSLQDYYAFGSQMLGRSCQANKYRYGFNGKENDNEVQGKGNQQDYGMRIYDPRIGRFLSIDPLTKNFPWYTPYQFSGNNPILNIDIDGLEEMNAVKRFLDVTIDMSKAPISYKGISGITVNTTYNLHGYPVNNLYFWEKFIEKYPSFLDEWNKGRVLVEDKSPIFTGELKSNLLKQNFDVDNLKIGDILDHHHINQGRTAVPLTRTEHKKIPIQKNPKGVKVSNYFGRFLKGVVNVMASIGTEITGAFTGNPEAMINQFGTNNKVGELYKNIESGLFYTITSRDQNSNTATSVFWIYKSFEWDDKQKKYIGSNPVGYGSQYEEKGGYRETKIFNLDGEIESSTSSGVKKREII